MSSERWADLDRPPLNARALRAALAGFWHTVDVVDSTGSTNADLVAAARTGANAPALLVAEFQDAGRGRLGRTWTQPPYAGIAMSILVRPRVAVANWAWLSPLAGVAVIAALTRVAELPADPMLKWPNDVLIADRKLGGILGEISGDAAVVGIGLNVTTAAAELPEAAGQALPATSLRIAGAENTDRSVLVRAIAREFAREFTQWEAAGGDADASGVRDRYRRVCATVGQRVAAATPHGERVVGEAVDIDAEGRLVIDTDAGLPRALAAADVTRLR